MPKTHRDSTNRPYPGPPFPPKQKKEKKTIPEEGSNKYYVHLFRVSSYTVIGADNIHHAFNKATKLWGPYWDRVSTVAPLCKEVTFISVKEFGKLIKKYQKLDKMRN